MVEHKRIVHNAGPAPSLAPFLRELEREEAHVNEKNVFCYHGAGGL